MQSRTQENNLKGGFLKKKNCKIVINLVLYYLFVYIYILIYLIYLVGNFEKTINFVGRVDCFFFYNFSLIYRGGEGLNPKNPPAFATV